MAFSFKNASTLADTTRQLVYTAPASSEAIVISFHLANLDASNHRVTVEVYDSSATVYRNLGNELLIPTQNTLSWDGKIVLEENDALYITGDTNGDIEGTAHILEKT